MKVLLIPDKFKGSATAKEVIDALKEGVSKVYPKAEIYSMLASDGGDGFLNAVASYVRTEEIMAETVDPLQRPITASYLFDKENSVAYIEMAKASGMELLKVTERNPMETSTYGTGLLMMDAITKGATKIYVGLGGSATNDGGIGIAHAMGYAFKNVNNNELASVGKNLSAIEDIECNSPKVFSNVSFYAVNDVQNPLFGKNGAAYVYGKQKGATDSDIEMLDVGLEHLDKVVQLQMKKNNAHVSGAGAAGGLGYGLKTFLDAEFIVGIDFLLELAKIPQLLKDEKIDYIITGEGKIDNQTLNGKLIKGVVEMGKQNGIPVIGVCGKLDVDKTELSSLGLYDVLEVSDPSKSLEYNMCHAIELIENSIFQYYKNLDLID